MRWEGPFLRDRQREAPAAHCGCCGGEAYRGDVLYTWEGALLCPACLEEHWSALTTREKAELLGARPVRLSRFGGN